MSKVPSRFVAALVVLILNLSAAQAIVPTPIATPTPSPVVMPALGTLPDPGDAPGDDAYVHLYHHRPMYIVWGKPDTKVQFSLKARVLKDYDLYFAYTQVMFWDFFKYSKPFHDINYNPELFYRFNSDIVTTDFGYEHESNGRDGVNSRGWNRIGIKFIREFPLNDDAGRVIHAELRTWYAYGLQDNRDLLHYRGQYEANVSLLNAFGRDFGLSEVGLRFYPGGKSEINPIADGGREISFRLRTKHSYDFFHLVVQLFEGRADQLLNYRDHVIAARIGIGF